MLKSLASVVMVFAAMTVVEAQAGDMSRIGTSIQAGNAKELSAYFDTNIEIAIYEDENVYSKAQAALVLKDFFNKHRPSSFKIIHNGSSKQGSQFGIGTLVTAKGTFRTYILIKQKDSKSYIQEIRFASDN